MLLGILKCKMLNILASQGKPVAGNVVMSRGAYALLLPAPTTWAPGSYLTYPKPGSLGI